MREKLLIVDDEKGVVDMLKSYFEMRSFQVYTAYSGEAALKLAAHNPDLVLLDINMPGMDGLKVCEKIRGYISQCHLDKDNIAVRILFTASKHFVY
ncbi:response regulator, partial [Parablautia muri]|nr:response regulator [Parablautia muri]